MASEKLPVEVGERGVELRNLDDAFRFGEMVIQSGLAPKGMSKAQQVILAVMAGAELGFKPRQSLGAMVVINGRVSIMGDSALGLVRGSGLMVGDLRREFAGDGDEYGCTVTSTRKDTNAPVSHSFTVGQAKRAKLWGKAGPWSEYPDRMLYYRALGFHLRDQYSDVLSGLAISEEVSDYTNGSPTRPQLEAPKDDDPLLEQITNGTEKPSPVEPETQPPEPVEVEPVQAEVVDPAHADAPPDDWQPEQEF